MHCLVHPRTQGVCVRAAGSDHSSCQVPAIPLALRLRRRPQLNHHRPCLRRQKPAFRLAHRHQCSNALQNDNDQQKSSALQPVTALTVLTLLALAQSAYAEGLQAGSKYVPQPYSPGWEIYVGFAAGVIPFLIGGWEFSKRIIIQQRCDRCKGSGLVPKRNYRSERGLRKCPECGGFFPWQGWKNFFLSTAAPGNGGPLMAPRNQSSVFYRVPDARNEEEENQSKTLEKEQRKTE